MGGRARLWGGVHCGEARCAGWENPCREVARGTPGWAGSQVPSGSSSRSGTQPRTKTSGVNGQGKEKVSGRGSVQGTGGVACQEPSCPSRNVAWLLEYLPT